MMKLQFRSFCKQLAKSYRTQENYCKPAQIRRRFNTSRRFAPLCFPEEACTFLRRFQPVRQFSGAKTLENGVETKRRPGKSVSERRRAAAMDAVVTVLCDSREPIFSMPWTKEEPTTYRSSGFAIAGRMILTCAHSVEHHTLVRVKKRDSDDKYIASVVAVGPDCDIALLSVNDEEFWQGISPLEFGQLPAVRDSVTVVGYPNGKDAVSATGGVVSRIATKTYFDFSTELLAIQVDAAINKGNSGGPAFNDKWKCVGIAYSSLDQSYKQNVGYLIPTPVITHFLQDYHKNGAYTGFPVLSLEWQNLENPDLRRAMGMSSNHKGIRIKSVESTSSESKILEKNDVILSIDGVDIGNNGTILFRDEERIGFSYLISQKYIGDVAEVSVLRDSLMHKFSIKLGTCRRLVPEHIKHGQPLSYYVVAGFVFTPLSVPYLKSEVLGAAINKGYEDIEDARVLKFNGNPVNNLKSLVQMVEACEDEFLKFDLDDDLVVALETKAAKAATADILATHCIPSAMSNDLKP